jgi:enoyl-CoA hydratase/carnithine racemase
MDDAVIYKTQGRIAVLTLNRPDKFNCISRSLLEGIESGIEQAEKDSHIRVIVIKASGKHFCTGADLIEVREQSQTRESLDGFIGYGHLVMQKLEASPLPVIAVINGYCLAGGLELMMCADVVIAADDARIGCQHAQYGLVPGWGGTQRLPRIVGMRRALDLMYSARWLTAVEALAWGLINQIVPASSLGSATAEYVDKLASRNPEALAAMKQLARQGADLSLKDALAMEQNLAVPALMSKNVAEGLQAFREKREPVFK